jgi:hypothetical protein
MDALSEELDRACRATVFRLAATSSLGAAEELLLLGYAGGWLQLTLREWRSPSTSRSMPLDTIRSG